MNKGHDTPHPTAPQTVARVCAIAMWIIWLMSTRRQLLAGDYVAVFVPAVRLLPSAAHIGLVAGVSFSCAYFMLELYRSLKPAARTWTGASYFLRLAALWLATFGVQAYPWVK
jgi:hypothetical protein